MRIQALAALSRTGVRPSAAMRGSVGGPATAATAAPTVAFKSRRWLATTKGKKPSSGQEYDAEAASKALSLGSSSKNALATTIADKPWVQLSTAEKATESVKTGLGGVVIAAGFALAMGCIYFIGKEAKESIFGVPDLGDEWRDKALEKMMANERVAATIGKNARIARVGDTTPVFEVESGAKECLRTTFLVMGDNERKAVVTLEIYKEASTGFSWTERFLLVDVQAQDLSPKFRIEVVSPVY